MEKVRRKNGVGLQGTNPAKGTKFQSCFRKADNLEQFYRSVLEKPKRLGLRYEAKRVPKVWRNSECPMGINGLKTEVEHE